MLQPRSLAGIPAVFCFCLGVVAAAGCGPELRDEDLGRIEYRLPELDEIGRGYDLPDLSPPAGSENDEASSTAESMEDAEERVSEPAGD